LLVINSDTDDMIMCTNLLSTN